MTEGLYQVFRETALKLPSKTVLHWKKDTGWDTLSYEGLLANIVDISDFLKEKDVKKGDRVAIILENSPDWPAIFFATVSLGAVAVPINPDAPKKEINNILADAGCKTVIDNQFRVRDAARPGRPASRTRNRFGGQPVVNVAPHDTACILYTSGTTDRPKGVVLSHKNLLSNCESLNELGLITTDDSVLSILPLHHAYSLTVTMLLPLLYGGAVIYPGSLRGEDILKAMRDLNPSIFVAVPQIYYQFHKNITEKIKTSRVLNLAYSLFFLKPLIHSGIRRKFGKSMRIFVSGGAKLDEGVEKGLFEFGFTILEGYGLTETSPVLTINPLENPKIGSVGRPIPYVELNIINKDTSGIGEVVVRGPNIMEGYYKRQDLTNEVIKDNWFYTGDLGYTDEDGYLFLTGRSKDVIVLSSGLNINPEEIEEAYLKDIPGKEMCVFEAPAKKGMKESQILWGVVRPDLDFFKKYGEVNLKHVIKERFDNVSRILPPPKRLMGFSITLEPFPRTVLGKIKRFEIKKAYTPKIMKEEYAPETKELSEEDHSLIEGQPGKSIINYLKAQTKVKGPIVPQNSLELDLGIDSLGRIELASGLEKVLGVKIEDELIGNSFTVRDLILGIQPLVIPAKAGTPAFAGASLSFPRKWESKSLDSRFRGNDTGGPTNWRHTLDEPPAKENLAKIDLNPNPWSWFCGFIFTCIWKAIFKAFYSLKAEGQENIPKKGPFIFFVNHTSYFDGFLVASALPKFPRLDLFFVGFRPYVNVPLTRNLVKIGRIIPLDFSGHLLEALRSSFYVLKNGKCLCLFPEGLRTLTGEIAQFKTGFGILAKESGALLVPVYLKGAFEAWPRTSKFPRRHPITVKFGKPVTAEEAEKQGLESGAKDSYKAICTFARQTLLKLA